MFNSLFSRRNAKAVSQADLHTQSLFGSTKSRFKICIYFPLQKTQRLTVSLPRNQKFVTRVNYKDSLAAIFRMVCREKNLDPYKYELRHPTHPDEPLNMATPLEHYGIHEINVVSVSGKMSTLYSFKQGRHYFSKASTRSNKAAMNECI